jgi:hypothetical protein
MEITLEQKIVFSKTASKQLKSLRRVFKELLSIHQDYIDSQESEDYPYWYKERPHVGLLAAAVWRSGGTALEEYRTEKTKERTPGRCDLWVGVGKIGFDCEAKCLRLDLGSKAVDSTEVVFENKLDGLNTAFNDVKELKSGKGLALCFATPWIRVSEYERSATCVHDWVNSVEKNGSRWDALIWIGVRPGPWPFVGDFAHPGMLLVVKELK